jgi:two-component system chemotaxis sensor kinase CheA
MAIDLGTVGRLEQFPRTQVERSGRGDVVQYRGRILQLLSLASVLGEGSIADPTEILNVVVYSESGRDIGLVVDRIVDIVEEHVNIETDGRRAGTLGRAVIQGRVTELLDVPAIVRESECASVA